MVRGRIGGTGDAFNLGEVTVTRATLRLRMEDGSAPVGFAVHMGRDKERATLAALVDALLQVPAFEARLRERVIPPLAARVAERRADREAHAAPTKVEFFTMVRGD
jgi:alpha-D-ribose 1-methylphosphonate 5-triphosphate synthase subunit PhnG